MWLDRINVGEILHPELILNFELKTCIWVGSSFLTLIFFELMLVREEREPSWCFH